MSELVAKLKGLATKAQTKAATRPESKAPTVMTTAGPVVGATKAKGTMLRFQGIPYAAPPVGERRWQPPAPVETWTEPRVCTKPGAMAWQRSGSMAEFINALATGLGLSRPRQEALKKVALIPRKQTEDCLTLNIRAPQGAQGLPVMFWVHGGDHTDGSSTDVFYNSDALPERGCVLVTINYRLGLFGFLAHPELAAESADGVSGNYGLLDQIAALEWVRDNITGFGGDPDNITIFGESAGGQAVLNLMTSPAARGLFHKAIAQSPSDSGRWLHHHKPVLDFLPATEAGSQFAEVAVGSAPGQLERLRAMDAAALYDLYRERPDLGRYFYPGVDGVVLPETPMSAFSNQTQATVPLMVGYNADEGSLLAPFMHPAGAEFLAPETDAPPVPQAEVRAAFDRSYGSPELAQQLLDAYPGLADGDVAVTTHHAGDHMFGVHVEHATIQHSHAGHPTYRYFYTAVPPSPTQTAGAFHAAEVFNVFGASVPLFPEGEGNHLLTKAMGDHWFAFAANGSPDSPGHETWPAFDNDNRKHMVFDRPISKVEDCEPSHGLNIMRQRIALLVDVHSQAEQPVEV